MLVLHHRNRILYRAKRSGQRGLVLNDGFLHPDDIGKEHDFFFGQMQREFFGQTTERGLDIQQFGVILAVDGADFVEKGPRRAISSRVYQ